MVPGFWQESELPGSIQSNEQECRHARSRRRLLRAQYRGDEARPGSIPDLLKGFGGLHQAAMKPGALDVREKELIAIGIGVAVCCENCIYAHVRSAVKAGAAREQILEAAGVGVMMAGGPARPARRRRTQTASRHRSSQPGSGAGGNRPAENGQGAGESGLRAGEEEPRPNRSRLCENGS